MKKSFTLLPCVTSVLLGALASCTAPNMNPDFGGRENSWAGDAIRNASLNNAIIAQHTIYPYHFAAGSADLNDLGQRDLKVLAEHFVKAHGAMPGELNIRRGDASEALYDARVKVVLECLAADGIPGGAVAVKDGLPGGAGMPSERVIKILKEKLPMQATSSGNSGSSSGSSSSSGTGIQ
jgi:hypothetical protein